MKFHGSFGSWLRQRRKALDLTQQDLADQVGYSVMTIRKIEGDERRPSKQITGRLADVLAISPDERAAFVAFARQTANDGLSPHADWALVAPAHNLPLQATPFVGRQNELAQIAERLCDPACRLLTVVGPGGIGKTRLALEAAQQHLDLFAQGVHFVPLAPVNSPDLLASAIAGALQFAFYSQEPPNTQIVNYLGDKRLLLVLDNFEHLLDGVGVVSDILRSAPGVKILTTSRERLSVYEEWVLPIDGLSFPKAIDADGIEGYDAIRLLAQCARRVQPDFVLADDPAALAAICQCVEGMPLGIELAAAWLRVMPCHEVAAQIRHSLDFLTTPLRNVHERHRNMRAVFDHSWHLLSESERGVLARLSVFRGGFNLEAAEQVAEASLPVCATLADKSMIRLCAPGRYDLHELLRQYAFDRLVESEEAHTTAHRHLTYFLGLAEQAEALLYGPHQMACFDRLEVEHDNLRAALGWSLSGGDVELGLQLAAVLEWFWHIRSYWQEGSEWLTRALGAARETPIALRAKALHRVADLVGLLGNFERATALCEDALTLARETGHKWNIAWSLSGLGFWTAAWDDDIRGQALLEEALAMFRELQDQWGRHHALSRLARAAAIGADYQRATAVLEETLRLAREADAASAIAGALEVLGNVIFWEGRDTKRAMAVYQESLPLFRAVRNRAGLAESLHMLGIAAYLEGDHAPAQAYYEESMVLGREMGLRVGISQAFGGLARHVRTQHDYTRACTLIERSLALAQQTDDRPGIAFCLAVLVGVLVAQGKSIRAAKLLGAAREMFDANLTFIFQDIRAQLQKDTAAVCAQLGEAAFAAAFAEGQLMTLDPAVTHALEPELESTGNVENHE